MRAHFRSAISVLLAVVVGSGAFFGLFTRASEAQTVGTVDGPSAGRFIAVVPSRFLDSRSGLGTTQHTISAWETVTVQMNGTGFPIVPVATRSVVVNFTVTEAAAAGYLTVYPCDAGRPTASNLNFVAGQTVANLVTVGLSAQGTICAYASARTELVADLFGFYNAFGQGFVSLTPDRLLDTRAGIGAPVGRLAGGQFLELQVTGRGGVPGGALSAILNVTVTEPTGEGWLAVYRCDGPRPFVSNLNFVTDLTVANLVYAQLDGQGRTCIYASAGTHVVADVSGYMNALSGVAFTTVVPSRVVDTRIGLGAIRLAAGETVAVSVRGSVGLPALATSAVMNATVTNPDAAGFLTVFPCDDPRPNASTLNFVTGQIVPNLTITRISSHGQVCLYSNASVDVIIDVNGYF